MNAFARAYIHVPVPLLLYSLLVSLSLPVYILED